VTIVTSLRELAKDARLSPCQVHRALRRLEGAHLIRWDREPGRGKKSRITLLWCHRVIHSPEEQQRGEAASQQENRNVSSHARDTLFPSEKKRKSHSGCAFDLPLGPQALAWAMAQVRNDLLARPSISPARRAAILGALGPAVHRALRKGKVWTRGELSRLVGFLLARLEERRGLGLDLPATRRWAEWAVREALRAIEEERERREAGEKFIRKLLLEREEARRAWEELLERGETFPGILRRDNRGDEPEPRGEGEASLCAFELGAGLSRKIPSGRARRTSGDVERSGAGGLSGKEGREISRTKAQGTLSASWGFENFWGGEMGKPEIREWSPKKSGDSPEVKNEEKAGPTEPTKPKEKPKEPEKLLLGKKVLVQFMDGTSLEGVISLMHQYTFVLERDGHPLLIYKHAVKTIEEVPSP
jgi:RNA chaperone Hfq